MVLFNHTALVLTNNDIREIERGKTKEKNLGNQLNSEISDILTKPYSNGP